MPPAELEEWRAARRDGPGALPEADDDSTLEAFVVLVDGVAVGGVLLSCTEDGGHRRCSVRDLETTLPSDATEEWAAVLTAVSEQARGTGAATVSTAVPPLMAPAFEAAGFEATVTTHAKRLDDEPRFQEDRRVDVRPMEPSERRSFARDLHDVLSSGLLQAGLLGPDTPLDLLDERIARLAADRPPEEEVLMTATVDGTPVGRVWGTLVGRDGTTDFLGHVIELFPAYRGRRLTPSLLGAMSRHLRALGVREISLRLYGHDDRARRSFVGAGVEVADVHLRKDLS
jgi:GNAT superfamily N-acetyltransferase